MGHPKYKICPECGKHNPPSLLECRYCEADLTSVKVVDSSAEDANTKAPTKKASENVETELVRICECGAENVPQARKCKACGEDISDIIPVRVENKAKKTFFYELKSQDGCFSIRIDKPLFVIGREAELKDCLQGKV